MNYCSVCCFNAVPAAGGTCGSCSARLENGRPDEQIVAHTSKVRTVEQMAAEWGRITRQPIHHNAVIPDDTAEHALLANPVVSVSGLPPGTSIADCLELMDTQKKVISDVTGWTTGEVELRARKLFGNLRVGVDLGLGDSYPASLEVGVPRPPDPPPGTMVVVDEATPDERVLWDQMGVWSHHVIPAADWANAFRQLRDEQRWTASTRNTWDANGWPAPPPEPTLESRLRGAIGGVLFDWRQSSNEHIPPAPELLGRITDAVLGVVGRPTGVVSVPGKEPTEYGPDNPYDPEALARYERTGCSYSQRWNALFGPTNGQPSPTEPETADHRPYLRELSREEIEYLVGLEVTQDKHPFVDRVAYYCRFVGMIRSGRFARAENELVQLADHEWGFMTDRQQQLCRQAVWKPEHWRGSTYEDSIGACTYPSLRQLLEMTRDKSDRPPNPAPTTR